MCVGDRKPCQCATDGGWAGETISHWTHEPNSEGQCEGAENLCPLRFKLKLSVLFLWPILCYLLKLPHEGKNEWVPARRTVSTPPPQVTEKEVGR